MKNNLNPIKILPQRDSLLYKEAQVFVYGLMDSRHKTVYGACLTLSIENLDSKSNVAKLRPVLSKCNRNKQRRFPTFEQKGSGLDAMSDSYSILCHEQRDGCELCTCG
nr:hypothetical protein [Tanacetum cinerariifolium]